MFEEVPKFTNEVTFVIQILSKPFSLTPLQEAGFNSTLRRNTGLVPHAGTVHGGNSLHYLHNATANREVASTI